MRSSAVLFLICSKVIDLFLEVSISFIQYPVLEVESPELFVKLSGTIELSCLRSELHLIFKAIRLYCCMNIPMMIFFNKKNSQIYRNTQIFFFFKFIAFCTYHKYFLFFYAVLSFIIYCICNFLYLELSAYYEYIFFNKSKQYLLNPLYYIFYLFNTFEQSYSLLSMLLCFLNRARILSTCTRNGRLLDGGHTPFLPTLAVSTIKTSSVVHLPINLVRR